MTLTMGAQLERQTQIQPYPSTTVLLRLPMPAVLVRHRSMNTRSPEPSPHLAGTLAFMTTSGVSGLAMHQTRPFRRAISAMSMTEPTLSFSIRRTL